jgi:hypothetical protein
MKQRWLGRIPAACGVVYVILGLSEGDDGGSPTLASSGDEIARYAAAHPLAPGRYLVAVASLFALLVFATALYSALRRTEPAGAVASVVVLAAGILAVAIKLSSFPALYALYSSPTPVDASVARSLWVQPEFAFVLMMLAQALMIGAAAVSGLLHGGISRWLAATGAVIAVALPLGVVVAGNSTNFLAELVWLAWVLVASVALAISAPSLSPERAFLPSREAETAINASADA